MAAAGPNTSWHRALLLVLCWLPNRRSSATRPTPTAWRAPCGRSASMPSTTGQACMAGGQQGPRGSCLGGPRPACTSSQLQTACVRRAERALKTACLLRLLLRHRKRVRRQDADPAPSPALQAQRSAAGTASGGFTAGRALGGQPPAVVPVSIPAVPVRRQYRRRQQPLRLGADEELDDLEELELLATAAPAGGGGQRRAAGQAHGPKRERRPHQYSQPAEVPEGALGLDALLQGVRRRLRTSPGAAAAGALPAVPVVEAEREAAQQSAPEPAAGGGEEEAAPVDQAAPEMKAGSGRRGRAGKAPAPDGDAQHGPQDAALAEGGGVTTRSGRRTMGQQPQTEQQQPKQGKQGRGAAVFVKKEEEAEPEGPVGVTTRSGRRSAQQVQQTQQPEPAAAGKPPVGPGGRGKAAASSPGEAGGRPGKRGRGEGSAAAVAVKQEPAAATGGNGTRHSPRLQQLEQERQRQEQQTEKGSKQQKKQAGQGQALAGAATAAKGKQPPSCSSGTEPAAKPMPPGAGSGTPQRPGRAMMPPIPAPASRAAAASGASRAATAAAAAAAAAPHTRSGRAVQRPRALEEFEAAELPLPTISEESEDEGPVEEQGETVAARTTDPGARPRRVGRARAVWLCVLEGFVHACGWGGEKLGGGWRWEGQLTLRCCAPCALAATGGVLIAPCYERVLQPLRRGLSSPWAAGKPRRSTCPGSCTARRGSAAAPACRGPNHLRPPSRARQGWAQQRGRRPALQPSPSFRLRFRRSQTAPWGPCSQGQGQRLLGSQHLWTLRWQRQPRRWMGCRQVRPGCRPHGPHRRQPARQLDQQRSTQRRRGSRARMISQQWSSAPACSRSCPKQASRTAVGRTHQQVAPMGLRRSALAARRPSL